MVINPDSHPAPIALSRKVLPTPQNGNGTQDVRETKKFHASTE